MKAHRKVLARKLQLQSQFSSELDEDSEIEVYFKFIELTKKCNYANMRNIAVASIRYGISV